jgi:hypothetical protein
VTAATTEPVTTATTAAGKPAGAGFARTRFVHRQSPAAQFGAVQRSHRLIRIAIYWHFDKREPSRLSRVSVFYDLYSIHLAVCGKGRIQILLSSLERNVPDIDVLQGVLLHVLPVGRVLISRGLISAGRLIKAGKVAVGGFEQPRIHISALSATRVSLI